MYSVFVFHFTQWKCALSRPRVRHLPQKDSMTHKGQCGKIIQRHLTSVQTFSRLSFLIPHDVCTDILKTKFLNTRLGTVLLLQHLLPSEQCVHVCTPMGCKKERERGRRFGGSPYTKGISISPFSRSCISTQLISRNTQCAE